MSDPVSRVTTIYRMEGQARAEVVWRLKGWYRVFDLADGGEYLIVGLYSSLVPLDYDRKDPMLRFFRRDTLLREVTLGELVPDLSKLERTASHFHWGNYVGFDAEGRSYQVRTVDRGLLRFDFKTGRLLD